MKPLSLTVRNQPVCCPCAWPLSVKEPSPLLVTLAAIVQHPFPTHVASVFSLDCFKYRLYDKLCDLKIHKFETAADSLKIGILSPTSDRGFKCKASATYFMFVMDQCNTLKYNTFTEIMLSSAQCGVHDHRNYIVYTVSC